MFNQVRFAWTSGKFIGNTWSPGGNYQSPANFGYIYFKGPRQVSQETVARVLSEAVPTPWILPYEDIVMVHSADKKTTTSSANEMASAQRDAFRQSLQRARDAMRNNGESIKKLDEYSAQADAVRFASVSEAVQAVDTFMKLQNQADEIYWRAKTEALIAQATN